MAIIKFFYMIDVLKSIGNDAGYESTTAHEREMLHKAINWGYVKGIGNETSNNYIALFLTDKGRAYLNENK